MSFAANPTDSLHVDLQKDMEMREENGHMVFLRRKMIIRGLDPDKSIIRQVSGGGVDQTSAWSSVLPRVGNIDPDYPNLVVTDRIFRTMEGTTDLLEVELIYKSRGEEENVGYFVPTTSLKQVVSENDINGDQITVSHTFPSDHDTFPSQNITQGVEVSSLRPVTEIKRTRRLFVNNMTLFSQGWVGKVNSDIWGGDAVGTWLCTHVSGKLLDASVFPNAFLVTFTFQYDPLGHQPFVAFIDPTTGRPPPNLVEGTGAKTVTMYPSRRFNQSFWGTISGTGAN